MFESLPAAGTAAQLSSPHCPPLPLLLAMGLHQILLGREFPAVSLDPEVGFQGKPEGCSCVVL